MVIARQHVLHSLVRQRRRTVPPRMIHRTHMNHGGGKIIDETQQQQYGPRQPLSLGLDAAKHTSNVLRLLETSHGTSYTSRDVLETVWHPAGLIWRWDNDDWKAFPALRDDANRTFLPQQQKPQLRALYFSDDHTALAKVQGANGQNNFISLLRLDADNTADPQNNALMQQQSTSNMMNDGWTIVRQVEWESNDDDGSMADDDHDSKSVIASSLLPTLQDYIHIEHGGGHQDAQRAEQILASQASLLSVGIENPADSSNEKSEWTAPTGRLVEISRETYLRGVTEQVPHTFASWQHDAIISVDVSQQSRQAVAAVAVVRVGNGAQTRIFEDHLLLGRDGNDQWKILSKIFSVQGWPEERKNLAS